MTQPITPYNVSLFINYIDIGEVMSFCEPMHDFIFCKWYHGMCMYSGIGFARSRWFTFLFKVVRGCTSTQKV